MVLLKNKLRFPLIFALLSLVIMQSCVYSSKSASRLLADARKEGYDIIVVPGVPLENGKWSRTMKARVYWAKYLYDQGVAKNIMFSGSAVYSPYREAEVMALYANAIGIPKENIFMETKAEHSTENIYYGYQKARKMGFGRIALASDHFQSKMLKGFVKKRVDPGVGILPMIVDTLEKLEPEMKDPELDFSPLLVEDFVALPERENFWKRFRGTRGLNIDKSAY